MNNGLDTESRGPGSSSPSSSSGEVIMDHCAVCLGDFHCASFDPGVGEGGEVGEFYDGLESNPEGRLVEILALTLCCRHLDKFRW